MSILANLQNLPKELNETVEFTKIKFAKFRNSKFVTYTIVLPCNIIFSSIKIIYRATLSIAMFILALILIMFITGLFFLYTERNVAYRYVEPTNCQSSEPIFNSVLYDEKNTEDNNNNEHKAIKSAFTSKSGAKGHNESEAVEIFLRRSIQRHIIPSKNKNWPNGKPKRDIVYDLAFLELAENGQPAEIRSNDKGPVGFNQLEAILTHLKDCGDTQHYVIAYIHGWRHDARIGDRDIKWLRTYAAHADSFLDFRCKSKVKRFCKAKVTAIYIGWRGARIKEKRGDRITEKYWPGNFMAILTLFDRKPVSERIGPTAVSALKHIRNILKVHDQKRGAKENERSRMLTIGHSLGGNALAVSLREEMVELVRSLPANEIAKTPKGDLRAPFGDLIVLLNPASEASNWTAIQRAVRQKRREVAEERNELKKKGEHCKKCADYIFSKHQKPIYISFTSADSWPAGGFRNLDLPEKDHNLLWKGADTKLNPSYDWATHDLFPLFKFDGQPMAATLEKEAKQVRCKSNYPKVFLTRNDRNDEKLRREFYCQLEESENKNLIIKEWLLKKSANLLRTLPFQNADPEETHTIGHLDPLRSPRERRSKGIKPTTRYGTTHEFIVNESLGKDTRYSDAADPALSLCAVVDGWLFKARKQQQEKQWIHWDSGYIKGQEFVFAQRNEMGKTVRMQFRYSLTRGDSPITGPNDPFWNIRAHDTAIEGHNGVANFPLICAMHQLVMDDVTAGTRNGYEHQQSQ